MRGTAERPRLSVFRSNRAIWVQVIDDRSGRTLAALPSTQVTEARVWPRSTRPPRSASCVAERAKAAGIEQVVFDRGRYLYHGRVKALADGAREGGLDF